MSPCSPGKGPGKGHLTNTTRLDSDPSSGHTTEKTEAEWACVHHPTYRSQANTPPRPSWLQGNQLEQVQTDDSNQEPCDVVPTMPCFRSVITRYARKQEDLQVEARSPSRDANAENRASGSSDEARNTARGTITNMAGTNEKPGSFSQEVKIVREETGDIWNQPKISEQTM